jgi:hypothetical protein
MILCLIFLIYESKGDGIIFVFDHFFLYQKIDNTNIFSSPLVDN